MARTVIAYYSRTGTAARVAEQLQELAGWPCTEVRDLKPREGLLGDLRCVLDSLLQRRVHYETCGADLGGRTRLVVIAPIWMGQLASPMRSLLHDLFGGGRGLGIEQVSLICVMGGKGAFNAADEIQSLVGAPPRPVLALRQQEVLDGSCIANLLAFKEAVNVEQASAGQPLRQAWLSPETR